MKAYYMIGMATTITAITSVWNQLVIKGFDVVKQEKRAETSKPTSLQFMRWPTLLAATGLACAVLLPAIARKPQLTSHGSARWAKPDEIRRAGLAARLDGLQGPVYAKLGAPGSNAAYLTSSDIPHAPNEAETCHVRHV